MVVHIPITSQFPEEIVQDVVRSALRNEAQLARFRYEQFTKECQLFEQRFAMTTEEFIRRFESGELGDSEEYFDWFASARGRGVWKQKAEVLSEVVG